MLLPEFLEDRQDKWTTVESIWLLSGHGTVKKSKPAHDELSQGEYMRETEMTQLAIPHLLQGFMFHLQPSTHCT